MKKTIFFSIIIFCIFLTGCNTQQNKQKKLIESFICTSEGVVYDLKFKMINLEEKRAITVSDSIVFLVYGKIPIKHTWYRDSIKATILNEGFFPFNGNTLVDVNFKKSIIDTMLKIEINHKDYSLIQIKDIENTIKELEIKEVFNTNPYLNYTSFIYRYKSMLNEIKLDIENNTDIEINKYKLAKKYSKISTDVVLSRVFDCTYSIFNPKLQVKQTQTKTFYFNNELTKIIR